MAQFWIDIYSAAGVKLNPHTQEVSGVRITERINQIGECTFTVPAIVASQLGSAKGLRYALYHEMQGYIGRFTHNDMTLDADQKTATITAHDSLIELSQRVIGFGKSYSNATIVNIINGVLGVVPAWSASYEGGFDTSDQPAAMEFRGETVLRGLDILRSYYRGYFRRQSDTSILFGDFHSTVSPDSLAPVARLFGPAHASAETSDYATIVSLKRERKGSNIINRVYPLGAGLGNAQVDLRYSNRAAIQAAPATSWPTWTIISEAIGGGETAYYLQDNNSVAAYGVIEAVLPFTEVRPITNSAADLQNAANALYDLAQAFIKQHADEQDIYSLSCINLPAGVKVGDPVRVDYSGVARLDAGDTAYLSIVNRIFFVTQITRNYTAAGACVCELVVSRSGDDIVGTTNVLSSIVSDVQRLKLRVQPHMTYFNRASPTLPIDSTRYIDFTFYLGSEVLALNEMKIEFRVMPLRAYASNTAAGGASSVTSAGGGSSTVTSVGGGGTTQTSTLTNVDHSHNLAVTNSSGAGAYVCYYNPSYGRLESGAATGQVTTFLTGIGHGHNVTIPSHTHDVNIPSHTHGVTLPDHTHALSFGVNDDTITPNALTVKVNGSAAGSIKDAATGTVIGASVTGAGLFIVDVLSLLTVSDFRNRTHTIRFECASGRGQVFAQLLGRVTIQPIAAS